jgi:hypothetical protein
LIRRPGGLVGADLGEELRVLAAGEELEALLDERRLPAVGSAGELPERDLVIRVVRVVARRELRADELGERGAVVAEEVGRVEFVDRRGAGGLGPERELLEAEGVEPQDVHVEPRVAVNDAAADCTTPARAATIGAVLPAPPSAAACGLPVAVAVMVAPVLPVRKTDQGMPWTIRGTQSGNPGGSGACEK